MLWNYLGLGYLIKDEVKKGRRAFEKSVDLDPSNAKYRSNLAFACLLSGQVNRAQEAASKVIELDPKNAQAYQVRGTASAWEGKLDIAGRDIDLFVELAPKNADAYLLKSEILLAKLGQRVAKGSKVKDELGVLQEALDTLTAGVSAAKGHARHPELEKELEAVGIFYRHLSRDPVVVAAAVPPPPLPGVKPVRILVKPRPGYTDGARTAGISGSVVIAALLGASGKIERLLILKRLGHGLDQQALKAASGIKFEPKTVDGKPVSSVVTFDYGFKIY